MKHVNANRNNTISLRFDGKPWEQLRNIPVDREGEFVYTLRPRLHQVSDRLMCQVEVKDHVKVVTLRSTYKIQNQTLYPLELVLVNSENNPVDSVQKIGA